jgi:hypothetical protein
VSPTAIPRLAALILLATTALVLALGSRPASAGLGIACPNPTAQVFRAWGDNAYYAYAPDGGFENGASGWALAGEARVVGGNDPYFLHARSDGSSLRLAPGASALSPPMCIGLLSSKMRFVIGGSLGSTVKVQVIYRGLASQVLGVFDRGAVTAYGTWAPSQSITMLGGIAPLGTQSVQFRFVAVYGAPLLDDVFLDPWKIT